MSAQMPAPFDINEGPCELQEFQILTDFGIQTYNFQRQLPTSSAASSSPAPSPSLPSGAVS
jgi:hypothetical protein